MTIQIETPGQTAMRPLTGLKIMVPESRELDLFVAMLESEGALALRCPLVQIVHPTDEREADVWIDRCIAGAFDDVIFLTGEGVRHLLALSGPRRGALVAALGRARLIVRGPKPTRALREIGLAPAMVAPAPTSQGVMAGLADEDLTGRRVGVQLYPGEAAQWIMSALRAGGAVASGVTPYSYASEAQSAAVADFIRSLARGEIGLIAFTASPQIERLAGVAKEAGLEEQLAAGLARTPVASVGPVVTLTLKKHGITPAIQPDSSFHLKPLVRAIVRWKQISAR